MSGGTAPLSSVASGTSSAIRSASAADVMEVTGLPTIEKGATFEQKSKSRSATPTTTFVVDKLEDLREIKLRCLTSGYYSQWALTEAQGDTYTEVEFGMEPTGAAVQGRRRHLR